MSQPQTGDSGKGTFSVYTDDKLDGDIRYKVPGDVQEHITWWRGTRTSKGTASQGGGTTTAGGGGGDGGKTATAVQATDVYPANDGNSRSICTMNASDKGKFLGKKPGEDDWVQLSGISGDCGGKDGWVWNGGSLKIQ